MAAELLKGIATASTTYDQRFDPADTAYQSLLDFHNQSNKPKYFKNYNSTEGDGHSCTHATPEQLRALIEGAQPRQARLGRSNIRSLYVAAPTPTYKSTTCKGAWRQHIHSLCHAAEQLHHPSMALPSFEVGNDILATWYGRVRAYTKAEAILPPPEVIHHLLVGPTSTPPPPLARPFKNNLVHVISDSMALCYNNQKKSHAFDMQLKH